LLESDKRVSVQVHPMTGTAVVALLLVVLLPLAALVSLGFWARWLCSRTSAPRWLVYPPASLPAVVSAVGLVIGMVRASGTIGEQVLEPGLQAGMLGEGISDAMSCIAIGMVLAILAAAWLLGLTWRYRWAR
jgi:hypothetical protein